MSTENHDDLVAPEGSALGEESRAVEPGATPAGPAEEHVVAAEPAPSDGFAVQEPPALPRVFAPQLGEPVPGQMPSVAPAASVPVAEPQPPAPIVAPVPAEQVDAPEPSPLSALFGRAPQVVVPEPAPQSVVPEPAPQSVVPETAPWSVAPETAPRVAAPEPAPWSVAPQPVPQGAEPEPAPQAAAPEPAPQVPAQQPAPAAPAPAPDPVFAAPQAAAPVAHQSEPYGEPFQTAKAPEVPQPTQELHPQAEQTQELHPQSQPTAPYPQQYGVPARPQPQYGQYAPGRHHDEEPYRQGPQQPAPVPPSAVPDPRRVPYPQQQGPTPQQQQGATPQQPGASFSSPYQPLGASEPPSQETRERKPRIWVPVASAAVLAALLASFGTAALVDGRDGSGTPTSIASLGNPGRVDSAPVKDSSAANPDWQAVTAAVSQSVVSIEVTGSQGGAEGSGFILDDKGHILTNNHVVEDAQNNLVQVTLFDGRLFQAKIVGTDSTTDLAVVELQDAPDNLKPVALGNSDDVKVGDPVLAVGNPLGLANTATTGIVSALDRPVTATGEDSSTQVVTNAIQIDAAINPGNSGGPLFDSTGRVIGITSSIASLSSGTSSGQSGSIGLGFAIPVNLAKNISSQLIAKGSAQHAFLGVSMQDGTATADGVTRRGAQVQQVTSGSPAASAGIKAGDVVVAIGDQPVSGAESLTAFVRERQAGEKVTLTVVRDGKAEQIPVTLAVRDESAQDQGGSGQQGGSGDQGQGDQGEDQVPPGLGGQDGSGSGSDGSGSGSDGSGSDGSSQGDSGSGGLWDWLFGGDSGSNSN